MKTRLLVVPTMAVLLDAVLLLLGQCLRGVEVGVRLSQDFRLQKLKEHKYLVPATPTHNGDLGLIN